MALIKFQDDRFKIEYLGGVSSAPVGTTIHIDSDQREWLVDEICKAAKHRRIIWAFCGGLAFAALLLTYGGRSGLGGPYAALVALVLIVVSAAVAPMQREAHRDRASHMLLCGCVVKVRGRVSPHYADRGLSEADTTDWGLIGVDYCVEGRTYRKWGWIKLRELSEEQTSLIWVDERNPRRVFRLGPIMKIITTRATTRSEWGVFVGVLLAVPACLAILWWICA